MNEILSERGDGEASGIPLHELRTFGAGTRHSSTRLMTRCEAWSAKPSFEFSQAAANRFEVKEGLRELLRSSSVIPFGRNCPKVSLVKDTGRERQPCEMSHIKGNPRQFDVKSAAGPGTLERHA
jgi:hypothetical protein